MFKNKYRIVIDNYLGYEVQIKKWWFPFIWIQCSGINTFSSVEKCEAFIANHKKVGVVVEYL